MSRGAGGWKNLMINLHVSDHIFDVTGDLIIPAPLNFTKNPALVRLLAIYPLKQRSHSQ